MIEEFIKDLKKSLRALKVTISEIRKDPGYDKSESFFIEDYEGNFRQHLKEFAFLVKKSPIEKIRQVMRIRDFMVLFLRLGYIQPRNLESLFSSFKRLESEMVELYDELLKQEVPIAAKKKDFVVYGLDNVYVEILKIPSLLTIFDKRSTRFVSFGFPKKIGGLGLEPVLSRVTSMDLPVVANHLKSYFNLNDIHNEDIIWFREGKKHLYRLYLGNSPVAGIQRTLGKRRKDVQFTDKHKKYLKNRYKGMAKHLRLVYKDVWERHKESLAQGGDKKDTLISVYDHWGHSKMVHEVLKHKKARSYLNAILGDPKMTLTEALDQYEIQTGELRMRKNIKKKVKFKSDTWGDILDVITLGDIVS